MPHGSISADKRPYVSFVFYLVHFMLKIYLNALAH